MKNSMILLSVLVAVGWCSEAMSACPQNFPLFRIERSKNRNIVQYDLCISNNGDVADAEPVKAYWILADGRKFDLNPIQKMFAYGIASQEKIDKDRFEIVTVALKDRKITVEKIGNEFRAILSISGKNSILERVFVKSEERSLGWPKVNYIDLFGRNLQTTQSVTERIVPD